MSKLPDEIMEKLIRNVWLFEKVLWNYSNKTFEKIETLEINSTIDNNLNIKITLIKNEK